MDSRFCHVSSVRKWLLSGAWALLLGLGLPAIAFALITGGEGNEPLSDPGWQTGAAAVFNVKSRVAYWEGPRFGGGQYTAECRGDTAALNAVLIDFAKIDAKTRRVTLHNGIGASFWLNTNGEEAQKKRAEIDWTFTIWIPRSWEFSQKFHRGRSEASTESTGEEPVPELHVFTAGRVHWADVKVPEGITVIDERLEAHGYSVTDGTVLEGHVIDLETKLPLTAQVELQLIKPQPQGGYEYETTRQIQTDASGKWVLKSTPVGWYQVIVSAPDHVSLLAKHLIVKAEPLWVRVDVALAPPGPVSGIVVDAEGKPLADVQVRFDSMLADGDFPYSAHQSSEIKTDAQGRFASDQLPRGKATLWIHKEGYCRPGLGLPIKTPASEVKLEMEKSAALEIVVEFKNSPRPGGYIIEIEPEGGSVVGSWGGSGNIDAANQITFKNIPPGRYVLKGRPNPGSTKEETAPVTVELAGGETEPLIIKAQ